MTIERVTYALPMPLTNEQRELNYRLRLAHWLFARGEEDKHELARRMTNGVAVMARLHARWKYLELRRKGGQETRPTLVLISHRRSA